MSEDDPSRREMVRAIVRVARYRPMFSTVTVTLGVCVALLEGVGVGFLVPIVELVRSDGSPDDLSGLTGTFVEVYQTLGVPFTLEAVVAGVSLIMVVRYTLTAVVGWLRIRLKNDYLRDIQIRAFDHVLDTRIDYYDRRGSNEVLNLIVTQSSRGSNVIVRLVTIVQESAISLVYLGIAAYISLPLAVAAVLFLGGLTAIFRFVLGSGYELGDELAEANERKHAVAQEATQGIREVRLFGLGEEFRDRFARHLGRSVQHDTTLGRNEQILNNLYYLGTAIAVFLLIYVAVRTASLSLGSLGLFLFAIFRLAPKASMVNDQLYSLGGELPHLLRTQRFIDEVDTHAEPRGGTEAPETVDTLAFRDVSFAYGDDPVLRDVSFDVHSDEFVAFVGPSGAGKSTIVSLIARLYDPDEGEITVDGTPVSELDPRSWRSRVAVVRQNPYLFDDTLRYNLTVGNRDAGREQLDRACRIARVDEFFDDLPDGYDTVLGDDGVRLSGGQRQRVALARALLKDAEVLLLDEATSDLDSGIERTVQRAIENMDRNYAIVTVAHRLSTVINADRIHVVEDGQIRETGSHRELLQVEGPYSELYEAQMEDV